MLRKWLPSLTVPINEVITLLIEAMLPQQPWVWLGKQYIGLVHGEIGIATQIVLSDPSYALNLESKLLSLLELQVGIQVLPSSCSWRLNPQNIILKTRPLSLVVQTS